MVAEVYAIGVISASEAGYAQAKNAEGVGSIPRLGITIENGTSAITASLSKLAQTKKTLTESLITNKNLDEKHNLTLADNLAITAQPATTTMYATLKQEQAKAEIRKLLLDKLYQKKYLKRNLFNSNGVSASAALLEAVSLYDTQVTDASTIFTGADTGSFDFNNEEVSKALVFTSLVTNPLPHRKRLVFRGNEDPNLQLKLKSHNAALSLAQKSLIDVITMRAANLKQGSESGQHSYYGTLKAEVDLRSSPEWFTQGMGLYEANKESLMIAASDNKLLYENFLKLEKTKGLLAAYLSVKLN